MKKIKINRKRAIELLAEAVSERGEDYVYARQTNTSGPTCAYVRDGEPSCGVGVALAKTGVTVEVLSTFDSNSAIKNNRGGNIGTIFYNGLLKDNDIVLTVPAFEVFQSFQRYQDSQHSWGESLVNAILKSRKDTGL